ncbi:MAG TPA: hypothetical protein PK718_00395 [Candidatus Methanofastidiosa archaeon]|nr:hypothetical protein [Candidatus Methanofastidiosa archaeon]HPR40993.1 hypothetical protein [Candidatus Methanofastidiosa archaeon]
MEPPDADRIGREHRDRLKKVKRDQRRAFENIVKPPDPKSCRYCKHYVTKDGESGYCLLWKKDVRNTDSCDRFSRV